MASNFTKYVSFIRGLALIHQSHHWITSGESFYGDHLLFERIYQSAQENADQAAEKVVGLFGSEHLKLAEQGEIIRQLMQQYSEKDPVESSLAVEKDFLAFSKEFYQALEDSDQLSLGMDDLIMAIANKREEAVYLLQQKSGHKKAFLIKKFKSILK